MDKSLDTPNFTLSRVEQLKAKPSLKVIYDRNYAWFKKEAKQLPAGKLLELGSGAGYLKEVLPQLTTSDIMELSNCDIVARAEQLPMEKEELSGIFMMDVLHHIPNNVAFLSEAQRTLKPGGKIIMIEPANTFWSRFIYKNFHHEPFEPQSNEWSLPEGGPLSVANGALPWIIFKRDWEQTRQKFPMLKKERMEAFMPLAYLVSGGFSYRCLLPDAFFKSFLKLEGSLLKFLNGSAGMFYKIVITKTSHQN